MSIDVWESTKSRKVQKGRDATTRSIQLFVRGAPDETYAESAALGSGLVPSLYYGLPMQSIDTDEVIAGYLYEVAVSYTNPKKNKDLGLVAIEFDTTGGKHKITNSLETVLKKAKSGETAPDFKSAINVSEKNVEGVDIIIPSLKFSLTAVMPFELITVEYGKDCARMTGRTNASGFFGFDAGELLFLGASGNSRRQSEEQPGVEMKYSFEASENASGLSIGDIDGIDKNGHDYLWVLHAPEVDNTAKFVPKRPKACYVERVYEQADFYALQIPTE